MTSPQRAHLATRTRPYEEADEPSWLRCRVLSFLSTQYYDDVRDRRPPLEQPSIALVSVVGTAGGSEVVGVLDIEIDGVTATIDTIAVHPDHVRQQIASGLLDKALVDLRARGVAALDAWTREDVAANAWYLSRGFVERHRYVHVHKEQDDEQGFTSPPGLSSPVRAFAHAPLELEAELRAQFRRVYVCRQYVLPLA